VGTGQGLDGRWQRGVRPCVVVSDPDVISDHGFPLTCVVPATSKPGHGLLCPARGLTTESLALIDQLRSMDKRRIRRVSGEIVREEMVAIIKG